MVKARRTDVGESKGDRGALKAAIEDINKLLGDHTIVRLGDQVVSPLEVIPTGLISLDLKLGGGLPRGRIVEFLGPEAGGKSSLALRVIAQVQQMGGTCVYLDTENALDPLFAKKIGVDIDDLYLGQPNTAEDTFAAMEKAVATGEVDVVVIDSVAAMPSRAELDGEFGQAHVGLIPRLMGQGLRKTGGIIASTGTLVIFINQLRVNLGVTYGSNEITPGGKALKFHSSVRLDIRRIEGIKRGDEVIGQRVRIKVLKNRVAPPFQQVELDMLYGQGFVPQASLLVAAVERGHIKKSGSWYSYDGQQIGQGDNKAWVYLRENPEIAAEIEAKVRECPV